MIGIEIQLCADGAALAALAVCILRTGLRSSMIGLVRSLGTLAAHAAAKELPSM